MELVETRVIHVNPADPRADRLVDPIDAIREGTIVALPTETFYGLAVDVRDGDALVRLNRLKGKPDDAPVLLLLADAAQVGQVADEVPQTFRSLVEMFWPGPLTLVVRASSRLPKPVRGPNDTVAVRVPGLTLPRRIAAGVGGPISGVSANLGGDPPCRTASGVARCFPKGLGMILDGGPTAGGAPSTILDLSRERPRVLRQGIVPTAALTPFLPDLERET